MSITADGYVLIYRPHHPNAQCTGMILEHRWVMSKHLGRALLKNEVVHHKNGNRADNWLRNLELYDRSEHMKHHRAERFPCGICGKPQLAKGLCHWHYNKLNCTVKCAKCGKRITKSTRPGIKPQRCRACWANRGSGD